MGLKLSLLRATMFELLRPLARPPCAARVRNPQRQHLFTGHNLRPRQDTSRLVKGIRKESTEAGDAKSGHINAGPNEGIFFLDSMRCAPPWNYQYAYSSLSRCLSAKSPMAPTNTLLQCRQVRPGAHEAHAEPTPLTDGSYKSHSTGHTQETSTHRHRNPSASQRGWCFRQVLARATSRG